MRLLDANELRTQFSSDEIYGPEEIKCIIDNAPTVEENLITECEPMKPTKDLINNIVGFDVSKIKPLPEFKESEAENECD